MRTSLAAGLVLLATGCSVFLSPERARQAGSSSATSASSGASTGSSSSAGSSASTSSGSSQASSSSTSSGASSSTSGSGSTSGASAAGSTGSTGQAGTSSTSTSSSSSTSAASTGAASTSSSSASTTGAGSTGASTGSASTGSTGTTSTSGTASTGGSTGSSGGSTGCTALTCNDVGASCGAPSDHCGGLLSCGSCSSTEVCGPTYHCDPLPDGGTVLASWTSPMLADAGVTLKGFAVLGVDDVVFVGKATNAPSADFGFVARALLEDGGWQVVDPTHGLSSTGVLDVTSQAGKAFVSWSDNDAGSLKLWATGYDLGQNLAAGPVLENGVDLLTNTVNQDGPNMGQITADPRGGVLVGGTILRSGTNVTRTIVHFSADLSQTWWWAWAPNSTEARGRTAVVDLDAGLLVQTGYECSSINCPAGSASAAVTVLPLPPDGGAPGTPNGPVYESVPTQHGGSAQGPSDALVLGHLGWYFAVNLSSGGVVKRMSQGGGLTTIGGCPTSPGKGAIDALDYDDARQTLVLYSHDSSGPAVAVGVCSLDVSASAASQRWSVVLDGGPVSPGFSRTRGVGHDDAGNLYVGLTDGANLTVYKLAP